jgi:circadian clock protein KaiC
VDGVVMLGTRLMGLRSVRTVEVSKLRGGPHLTGQHTFDITHSGLEVYPRLETLYPQQHQGVTEPGRRLTFDVPGLDTLLGGGLPANSCTMLLGSSGSGKTMLGLHFLGSGARHGEPGLYYGFMENAPRLLVKAAGVGLELGPDVDSGRLVLETMTTVGALPDALVPRMLELAERHRVRRLFIDGLEPFSREMLAPERVNDFLTALFNTLRTRGITFIVSQHLPTFFGPRLEAPLEGSEALADNLIFLRHVELRSQLYRMLSVLKMRESTYDGALREFHIRPEGIDVSDTFESAEAILTGQARPRPSRKSTKRPRKPGRPPPRRRSRS